MLPWYVDLWVVAVIGQAAEKVDFVPYESKAVSKPGAGGRAIARCTGPQSLPLPATRLPKHKQARSS